MSSVYKKVWLDSGSGINRDYVKNKTNFHTLESLNTVYACGLPDCQKEFSTESRLDQLLDEAHIFKEVGELCLVKSSELTVISFPYFIEGIPCDLCNKKFLTYKRPSRHMLGENRGLSISRQDITRYVHNVTRSSHLKKIG